MHPRSCILFVRSQQQMYLHSPLFFHQFRQWTPPNSLLVIGAKAIIHHIPGKHRQSQAKSIDYQSSIISVAFSLQMTHWPPNLSSSTGVYISIKIFCGPRQILVTHIFTMTGPSWPPFHPDPTNIASNGFGWPPLSNLLPNIVAQLCSQDRNTNKLLTSMQLEINMYVLCCVC